MLLVISFLFAGCDFFGTRTTELTTGTDTGTYYQVIFFDGDGSVLETQEVLEGEDADNPDTPTKASTAQYTYTFDHWDKAYTNVTEDLLINPVFNASVNQYTVTFYDEDETTVLGTSTVPYGTAATPPADPTKEDDETYTYEFDGWSVDFSNVTGNLSVYATYEATAIQTYTVSFYANGVLISTQTVQEGEAATAPANPTKAATAQYTYTFDHWDTDFSNVTSDLTVTAVFSQTVRQYTVTFYNADGAVLTTQQVAYGSGATAPANPTMAPTAQYTYTFSNWSVAFNNITGNLSVTAVYTQTVNVYTVNFYDHDGTLLKTEQVAYGSGATAPTEPTRATTAQYTYTFSSWSVAFNNIVGNLDVTAVYTETVNTYSVVFYDYDGTAISTQEVAYGSAAVQPIDPTRNPTAQYTYSFLGWDVVFGNITGPLSVHALYSQEVNSYAVTFYDEDGTVLSTQNVEYGDAAIAPANPFKAADATNAYQFNGWDVAFDNITGNLDVTATYLAIPLDTTHVVKFYDAEGIIISSQVINHGEDAVAPADPTKDADAEFTYVFSGWDVDFTNVQSALNIYPLFDEVLNQYTVTFYDYEGTVIGTELVNYGDGATAPSGPTRPDDASYSYTFIGWDVDFSIITGTLDVHPVYFKTSLGAFNRQDLLDLDFDMFEPENVEEHVAMMLDLLNADSEEDLYNTLLAMNQIRMDFMDIGSAADILNLYTEIQILGFDKETLIDILYNVMVMGMTNDLTNIQEQIDYLLGEIAAREADILAYQQAMADILTEMNDYCLLQVGLEIPCQSYVADLLNVETLKEIYEGYLYGEILNSWDWDTYYDLLWNIDDYLYFLIVYEDPSTAQMYLDAYNAQIADLSTEDALMYEPILTAYIAWRTAMYTFEVADYSMIDVVGTNDANIIVHLNTLFYGYWLDEYTFAYGYTNYRDMINSLQWLILELQWEIEDLERELESTQAMVNYLISPMGETEALALMGTIYDALEALLLEVDQETFDFVMYLIDRIEDLSNPYYLGVEYYDPYYALTEILSVDNIMFVSGKLDTFLSALMATMDETDYANIKAAIIGYFGSLMNVQGKTELEIAEFMLTFEPVVDRYMDYVQFGIGEVLDLLGSMTPEKAEAIQMLILGGHYFKYTDIESAIQISWAINTLISDNIDINTIFEYLSVIYFDMNYEFVYDAQDLENVQAAVDTFITDYLALMGIIKDYDPTYMTPSNIQDVMEFYARFYAMMDWFSVGLETSMDPLTIYYDYYLASFLSSYLGEWDDIDDAILKYKDILGEEDPEQVFYKLFSIYQYITGVFYFEDFADIQYWVANIESFGHTQPELIAYFINFMKYASEIMILGDEQFQWELDNLQSSLEYWQDDVDYWLAETEPIENLITTAIALLPFNLQATAQQYWDSLVNYVYLQLRLDNEYDELEWQLGETEALQIDEITYNLSYYHYPLDQTNYDIYLLQYNALYDSYSYSEYYQELISQYRAHYDELRNIFINTYSPLYETIIADENYAPFIAVVDSNINSYMSYYMCYMDSLNHVNEYLQYIDELYNQLLMAYMVYDIMHDEYYSNEAENVIGYLLDDLQNMITSMPSDSFAMIEKLFEMMKEFEKSFVTRIEPEEPSIPMEFNFTPQEIFDFTQELSAFLKLRGDTLTTEEITEIEQFIYDCITVFIMNTDVEGQDAIDMADYVYSLVLKYLDYADLTLTEITDFLDGLTVEKVTALVDYIQMVTAGNNIYQMIVMGAQLFESLFDTETVDLGLIINIINEVYYDINYGYGYDPLDLAALQTAWEDYLDEVLGDIAAVAALDPYDLDPSDFGIIVILQQKIMFFANIIQNPEAIFFIPDFGYTIDDFYELMFNMFSDTTWENVDEKIEDLCSVFGLTYADNEEVYYIILGLGSMLMNLDELNSPTQILAIYQSIAGMGFTNAEIAEYLVNAFMLYVLPTIPENYDTSDLVSMIGNYEAQIAYYTALLDSINDNVYFEISQLSTSDEMEAATNLWEAYKIYYETLSQYEFFYYMNCYGNDMFNNYFFEELKYAVDCEDWTYLNEQLNYLDSEEYDLYNNLINLYIEHKNAENWLYYQQSYFDSNYSYLMTSFNPFYSMSDYLYSIALSEYYSAYSMQFENDYNLSQTLDEIARIEENAWVFQTIEAFFADPDGEMLAEAMLTLILDEVEALALNPDVKNLEEAIMILVMNFELSDASDITYIINAIGGLMGGLGTTFDEIDEAIILDFIHLVIESYVGTTGITDPVELQAEIDLWTGIVDTYFDGIMNLPTLIGAFLQSVTVDQTQSVIDQIAILNTLPTGDEDNDNLIRIIAISNIIAIITQDDTLDYTNILSPVFGLVYDVQAAMGTEFTEDNAVMLLTTLTYIGDIINQAELVALIDVDDILPEDMLVIDALVNLIDDFGTYISQVLPIETS